MRRHYTWMLWFLAACAALSVPPPAAALDTSYAELERGRRLTEAGDCIACHTIQDGGVPYAGGRRIETPFGVIYSPNITPDPETGIGDWSEDEFYRAMHQGIGPDGTHLYPAFPYPYFTKLTRDDVDAIYAFLNVLEPVKSRRHEPELIWPLNYRPLMAVWNWMFFEEGTFQPSPDKSAEWNRGAYLVQGPGHCGACHSPKNILGADNKDYALEGGTLQNWFAPDIAANHKGGTGSWSTDDIVEYLKTGRNAHSGATGLMAEVVEYSTSKLPESDLRAIAAYLKDKPKDSATEPEPPDKARMAAGEAIFRDSCSGCHRTNGKGVPRMFPPLVENAIAQSNDPTTVIRVILEGARTVPTDARPTPFTMPAFDWKLSDAEIAAVATYVRNAWGNAASPVAADQVSKLREALHAATH